jgi:hypothetical protein
MADDSQKNPFVKNIQLLVAALIEHMEETRGKSLPVSVVAVDPTGTIVTVKVEVQDPVLQFPQFTCPVGQLPYIRFPIQVGQKGVVFSADAYLGGMSDLGGGTATLAPQGNLSTCVYYGTGNAKLDPTDDPQATVIYGPNGAIVRDEQKQCVFILTPQGIEITLDGVPLMKFSSDGISMNFAGNSISMTESGIDINGQGLTQIDGHNFLLHDHTGVQPGSGSTGPVSP